jgi:RimJ/RimL family protein N-acetyltransferase
MPEYAAKQSRSNLESERVLLRKLSLFDAKDVFRNIRAKETAPWPLSVPRAYPEKPAVEFARRGLRLTRTVLRLIREELRLLGSKKEIRFGIVLKETGRVIGIVALRGINYQSKVAETGFWIGIDFWGEGLATEAVRLALDFGFKELQLHRVNAWTAEENMGSRRVMEKCGFKSEGVMRDAYFVNGRRYNRLGYGILESEHKAV